MERAWGAKMVEIVREKMCAPTSAGSNSTANGYLIISRLVWHRIIVHRTNTTATGPRVAEWSYFHDIIVYCFLFSADNNDCRLFRDCGQWWVTVRFDLDTQIALQFFDYDYCCCNCWRRNIIIDKVSICGFCIYVTSSSSSSSSSTHRWGRGRTNW